MRLTILLTMLLAACAPDIETVCTVISGPIGTCSSMSICQPDIYESDRKDFADIPSYIEADGEAFICADVFCVVAMDDALDYCGIGTTY